MRIGIFSKLGSSGGSEHRVVEMANGLARFSDHECWILCEKNFNNKVSKKLDPKVKVIKSIFHACDGKEPDPNPLYEVDSLLIVDSDSYSFPRLKYWEGKQIWDKKPPRHTYFVDVSKIPQMVFLFNFVVKPARWLWTIAEKCPDVRIVLANRDYFREIQSEKKHDQIRNMRMMILDSPIDPETVSSEKTPSDVIRIGRHSKPYNYKYDVQCTDLIKRINKKYADKVYWDFMGIPTLEEARLKSESNVLIRKEYSKDVKDYLNNIDIMLFFIKWSRSEPWARVVAEGMASGCPILATNKAGNQDQVRNGKNGYLCSSLDEFEKQLSYLIENPDEIKKMGQESSNYAKDFTTEKITKKYLDFIRF